MPKGDSLRVKCMTPQQQSMKKSVQKGMHKAGKTYLKVSGQGTYGVFTPVELWEKQGIQRQRNIYIQVLPFYSQHDLKQIT